MSGYQKFDNNGVPPPAYSPQGLPGQMPPPQQVRRYNYYYYYYYYY